MRKPLVALLIATCALHAGCKPPAPLTTPVTGLVTLDGQPCAGAIVSFVPTGETRGNGGMGRTDDAGKFVAFLHDNKSPQGPPGLFPGTYKVVINKSVNPDGTPFVATPDLAPIDSNAKELLPEVYSNFEQTKLKAEVGAAAADLKFELRTGAR